ncbi:MAE_28990/MAE_18760 family HEPN-like nuclease [Streptomyces tubbatahanensis]|uniref:MAE_28990/MAE_18760 family HEPN-like nuclease n=1 Tax=Streptomyces tubbatahanensis TaxID=2923272 RepID=A0ABY3XU99_9ACTN|nr:MAE_28990/MAE_18760 family HEPN-like nuclease [Streptomyces tubbatahanensis]UNS98029.1 MAE_28990/MAE_18760 family HEPN-like nuclease [Streptomyces tubbatahanensis]
MDLEKFNDKVQRDLSLRKVELSRFSVLFQEGTDQPHQDLLHRAAVILSYAHWEGFVKSGSSFYVKHINACQLPVERLKYPLQAAYVASRFKQASASSKNHFLGDLLDCIDTDRKKTFSANPNNCFDTESNLSSIAFKALVQGLGLDYLGEYETRSAFIDEKLLHGRNKVAHGELVRFDRQDAEERLDSVRYLLDLFSDQLLNAARDQCYLSQ